VVTSPSAVHRARAGQVAAHVGANGAAKTTLLTVLSGLRPTGWCPYRPPSRGKTALAELEQVNSVPRGLAEAHGRTPAQVALRWLVQQPGVIPIPGAKNGRQAAENVGVLSFELSDQEIRTLSG
jgi:diketogulonate reductase-like aldo/keto reductase